MQQCFYIRAWRVALAWSSLFVATFLFLFAVGVSAQEVSMNGKTVEEKRIDVTEAIAKDTGITRAAFQTKEARVLPDSPLYRFKKMWWGVEETFTFDPVADTRLKIEHSNQQMYDVHTLVTKEGIENVDPKDIQEGIEYCGRKFREAQENTMELTGLKEERKEEVEQIVRDMVGSQVEQRKVVDTLTSEVIETLKDAGTQDSGVSQETREREQLFATLADAQQIGTQAVGRVLSDVVVEPDQIAETLTKVLSEKEGSEFRHIRYLEILENLEKVVPAGAQEALQIVQKNTVREFTAAVEGLPAEIRSKRFAEYVRLVPGDEVEHIAFLDQLKTEKDVPVDILRTIEEVKEFAVQKFEEKGTTLKTEGARKKLVAQVKMDTPEDFLVAEELRRRMQFFPVELAQEIQTKRDQAVEAFMERFTDAESTVQVQEFRKLETALLERPGDPKALSLLSELEGRVKADPTKRAFIENFEKVGEQMNAKFEAQFRLEGSTYAARFATLHPKDMEVYFAARDRGVLRPELVDQMMNTQTQLLKEYVNGQEDSAGFEKVYDRFRNVDERVVKEFKQRQPDFQEVVQSKMRRIEQAKLAFEEKELTHQLEKIRKQEEDVFWRKFSEASPDERERLLAEKRERELGLVEKEFAERAQMTKTRFEKDPFCDETCQQIQFGFLEQEFRHRTENLTDDYRKYEFEIHRSFAKQGKEDPFAGRCITPEDCIAFCISNPAFSACQIHKGILERETAKTVFTPVPVKESGEPVVAVTTNCGPGLYYDRLKNTCEKDPYYRSTEPRAREGGPNFPEYYCEPGSYYDWNSSACKKQVVCEAGFFYDYFEQTCKKDYHSSCGPGQYWDYNKNTCIIDPQYEENKKYQCPPQHFWNFEKKTCVRFEDPYPIPVPEPIPVPLPVPTPKPEPKPEPVPVVCTKDYEPVCGIDGKTYGNECKAKAAGVGIASKGKCVEIIPAPLPLCTKDQYWDPTTKTCKISFKDCGVGKEWDSYNQTCHDVCTNTTYWNSLEKKCVSKSEMTCGSGYKYNSTTQTCVKEGTTCSAPTACESCPSGSGSTNWCVYNNDGCPKKCMAPCPSGQWYDSTTDSCKSSTVTTCPTGEWYDSSKGMCVVMTCPTGWYTNATTKTCVKEGTTCSTPTACSSCTSGCSYDTNGCPTGCPSTIQCATGYHWVPEPTNPKGGYCAIDSSTVCPSGFSYNTSTKTCVKDGATCSNPTACTACTSGTGNASSCVYDQNGCPTQCASTCPSGQWYDSNSGTCKNTGDCPSGWYKDTATNSCVKQGTICSNPTICDACKSGSGSSSWCVYDSNTGCPKKCTPSCPSGQWYDSVSDTCKGSTTDTSCPSGWVKNTVTNTCVKEGTSCSTPTVCNSCAGSCTYDSNGCPTQCSSNCPSGQWYDSGSGTCKSTSDMTCPSGYTKNTTTNTCVKEGATCSNPTACSACTSGCTYDSSGCPTGCTPATPTCSNSGTYSSPAGSYSCNTTTCPNGCSYDSAGCPSGCYTVTPTPTPTPSCSSSYSATPGSFGCNYSTCPSGCTFDSSGCPSGCYTPPSTPQQPQTPSMSCPSNQYYDSTQHTCVNMPSGGVQGQLLFQDRGPSRLTLFLNPLRMPLAALKALMGEFIATVGTYAKQ